MPAGTYTVSFSGTKRSQLYLVAGNDSNAQNLITDVNGGTFTISESKTLHFGLNLNNGTTYNDSFYIQLEAGSTATPYQPYGCIESIKIATTKYNETKFSPLNTALQNAISVVDTVVSNTITQAASIATLQAQKQTRPNDIADDNEKCPEGKKCLLVEDASGVPHWYEIVTGRLPDGYTELEYIESTGTQWIDTGVVKTTAGNVYRLDSKTSWADVQERQLQGCQDMFYYGPVAGYFQVAQGSNDHTTTPVVANTVYEVDVTFDAVNNTATYSVNGTQYTVDRVGPTGSYMTGVDGKNFAVFSLNEGILPFGNSKVYYYKLWKNGTLVRNLVPAKNSSGVVGMYDLANGVFYENAGEGSFIVGDPVSE